MSEQTDEYTPSRLAEIGIVTCVLTLAGVLGISSMMLDGPTFDEPVYMMAGYEYLKAGNLEFNSEHPPLWKQFAAIPIILSGQSGDRFNPWDSSNPLDLETALFRSRMMLFSLFFITGLVVYIWSKELHGIRGGLISLVLYGLCPNILAYSRLITPDFPVTAFTLLTAYAFWVFCNAPESRVRAIWVALPLGAALASRFSALILPPAMGLVLLMSGWRTPGTPFWTQYPFKRRWWLAAAVPLALTLAASVVLLVCYQFVHIDVYLRGLSKFVHHASISGHSAYLWNNYSDDGWWYYFFVVIALKTPLPALLLISLAVVAKLVDRKVRPEDIFLWSPVVVLMVAACVNRVNLGVRLILPIFPLLYVFAGSLARSRFINTKWLNAGLAVCLLWYVAGNLRTYPHYISYFNETVGENGYQYLSDSNLDWGQDLPRLVSYARERGVSGILLAYYGLDSPEYYGLQAQHLPTGDVIKDTKVWASSRGYLCREEPRLVAVSATLLKGVPLKNHSTYRFLEEMTPVKRIGHSIFVYDITDSPAASREIANAYDAVEPPENTEMLRLFRRFGAPRLAELERSIVVRADP